MNNIFKTNLLRNNITGQLFTIFLIQTSAAAAFAIFYSGLSIYLTQNKHFSKELAAQVTSLFLSLNYFLPLIGGLIANRFISYKRLYFMGTLASFAGALLLSANYLYLGLALFLINSLANVCITVFLTQLFSPAQKTERRVAFIWNYMGMNLGFMLGYFLTGFSTLANNYFHLFILMSVLVGLASLLTMIFIKEPIFDKTINKKLSYQILSCFFIMLLFVILNDILLHYVYLLHHFITILTIIFLCFIMCYAFITTKEENRKNVILFINFSLLAIIFWTFYMLTPIAIMQLIEHCVKRHFFNITFAPQWFTNINSFVILLCAPILTYIIKNKKMFHNASHYFTVGFIFTFLGTLSLAIGFYFSYGYSKLSPFFILSYLIFLTFGEIFISPISDSFIGEYIEESQRGLMAGASRVNLCIGVLLASTIANKFILPYINKDGLNITSSVQLGKFFFIVCILFLVLAFTISIMLKRRSSSD